jgi:hypothetical protein
MNAKYQNFSYLRLNSKICGSDFGVLPRIGYHVITRLFTLYTGDY